MRIVYQDGRLYVSLTKEEIQQAQDSIGMPLELPIGQLKIFQEDIHKAAMAHWSKIEVPRLVMEHQRSLNSTPKKKK